MTAPTEAEILDSLRQRVERWPDDNPMTKLRDAIESLADFMHVPAYAILDSPDPLEDRTAEAGDIWGYDLRPSEARALDYHYREAVEHAMSDAQAAIDEVIVRHALAFAAEFPDAPRAKLEPVTA
jgi:hypothetical protein